MVAQYLDSNLCHLPWTSLETTATGNYRPCCLYKGTITDSSNNRYTTLKNKIKEVQNSNFMHTLRQEFLDGKKPDGCSSCWKEEAVGKTSKRQHMWRKAGTLGQYAIKKNIVAPHFIDLKLGNICNLKCRICSPHSSSQWVSDMIKLNPHQDKQWKQYNKEGAWPREKNAFLESVAEHVEQIRFFEITGGEPLMIQEQFDILQKCIDKGSAKLIDVHYNTNGTQYPDKAIKDIWPHFKRIEVAFSIDDVGERFEYQRTNAKWIEVKKNIEKFKASGLKNLSIQVCTTINFFNIFYLDELAKVVKEWAPDFWYINVLHQPEVYDVQQLPTAFKNKVLEKIKQCDIYKSELQSALDYLQDTPGKKVENWHNKLISSIKSVDYIRKENFAKTFPELDKEFRIYE